MDGQTRIPILKVGRVLIVPIQVDMDDQTVMHLQERILSELERTGARGVLIDISLLEMVDSFIGRVLSDTVSTPRSSSPSSTSVMATAGCIPTSWGLSCAAWTRC